MLSANFDEWLMKLHVQTLFGGVACAQGQAAVLCLFRGRLQFLQPHCTGWDLAPLIQSPLQVVAVVPDAPHDAAR